MGSQEQLYLPQDDLWDGPFGGVLAWQIGHLTAQFMWEIQLVLGPVF